MSGGAAERPPMNVRRVLLGLAGLVVGFLLLIVGLNTLSQPTDPPPSSTTRPSGTTRPAGSLPDPAGTTTPGTR